VTKRTQPTPDDYDLDAKAAAALDEARELPPGPERTEALKRAGLLRNAADVFLQWRLFNDKERMTKLRKTTENKARYRV
jgi:hypothetical protein